MVQILKGIKSIPKDIPLTGFSVVLARLKGDFENYVKGTPKISELKDGDRVLLLESCTHHVSCDDIKAVAKPVLRHRILTNFNAEADGITSLDIIDRLLEEVKAPDS